VYEIPDLSIRNSFSDFFEDKKLLVFHLLFHFFIDQLEEGYLIRVFFGFELG